MRILVTGVSGFIGSGLVRYLANFKKYRIFALVRKESNLGLLNVTQDRICIIKAENSFRSIDAAIRKARPDVVVHLAALTLVEHTHKEVKSLINSNILFSTLLAEAMIKNGVTRLVNTGSYWEYMKGDRRYLPVNLYAATKYAFEQILKFYADAYNLHYVTLKLYNVYGPNVSRRKIFYLFKKSLVSKKPILLSCGEQKIDFVYIDDILAAYEKAIKYVFRKQDAREEVFFIGTGKGMELRKVGRIFEQCVGSPLNVKWGGVSYRPREIMFAEADISSAKTKLGWKPRFDLKNGILKMLQVEQTN